MAAPITRTSDDSLTAIREALGDREDPIGIGGRAARH